MKDFWFIECNIIRVRVKVLSLDVVVEVLRRYRHREQQTPPSTVQRT
jgi:hypothetical protein